MEHFDDRMWCYEQILDLPPPILGEDNYQITKLQSKFSGQCLQANTHDINTLKDHQLGNVLGLKLLIHLYMKVLDYETISKRRTSPFSTNILVK